MKVVFGIWNEHKKISENVNDDCYILTSDNWNDFGLNTYFNVHICYNGELYGIYSRKILFKGHNDYKFLTELKIVYFLIGAILNINYQILFRLVMITHS